MSAAVARPAQPHLARWEQVFATRAWGKYPSEDLIRFMARRFAQKPRKSGVRVLEIGCGPGANLWYLGREGYALAGIDGSPTAIRQARQRLEIEGVANDAELMTGDFTVLPWSESRFDVVLDIEALSTNRLDTVRAALAEIGRVLKPGGVVFAKMFGPRTTGCGTGREIEPMTYAEPTDGPCSGQAIAHFFEEAELRTLFAGFGELTLDWSSRSERGGAWTVFEWLVSARKPG